MTSELLNKIYFDYRREGEYPEVVGNCLQTRTLWNVLWSKLGKCGGIFQ